MSELLERMFKELDGGLSEDVIMSIDGLTECLSEEIYEMFTNLEKFKDFESKYFHAIGILEEHFLKKNDEKGQELYSDMRSLIFERDQMLTCGISKYAFMRGVSFCNHLRNTL